MNGRTFVVRGNRRGPATLLFMGRSTGESHADKVRFCRASRKPWQETAANALLGGHCPPLLPLFAGTLHSAGNRCPTFTL